MNPCTPFTCPAGQIQLVETSQDENLESFRVLVEKPLFKKCLKCQKAIIKFVKDEKSICGLRKHWNCEFKADNL